MNHRMCARIAPIASTILAAAGALPGAAFAQADTVPPDTIRPVPVEGVEVTVLRSPITLTAAPLAVSVLGEAALRDGRSGAFLEEALRGMPGVQVQNRYNPAVGERVAIRGFGSRPQFGVRGVRIIVDGIPATLPDGQSTLEHLDLGSLGRVEAIRGPASALFGNASGGVLAFHTRPPSSAPIRLEAEAVAGSHGMSIARATGSGTVNRAGYLVSVSAQRWDGFRTNPVPTVEGDTYGRADRLGLNARFVRPLAGGELSVTANLLDLDSENPGSLAEELRSDPDRPAFAGNVNQRLGKEVRQGQAGVTWSGPLAGLDTDLSAFGVRRTVVNPIPGNIIDLGRDGGGIRVQIGRFEDTAWGPLRWHAGIEGELMLDDRKNFANQQGEPGELRLDQRERVRGAGVFLQATLPLPGEAQALAGLRYDRHDFRARDRFPRDEEDPSATGARTMDAFSPSLGVNVPVTAGMHAFASVATVFETPSTTELANRPEGAGGFNADLEPQRGTSGEAGLRGRPHRHVTFEVAAFRADLRNELVPFELPDRTFFRNAGASRHSGLEATVSAASPGGLARGDLTYTRIDARFRRYEKDGEELGGNRVPGLAPQRGSATLRLTPPGWFGELTGSYLHRVPVDDENTEEAPSYFLVDARAGARGLPIAAVTFAPWVAVTNVLDRAYTASVVPNAFGRRFYEPGPGRSFQVGLRASWGDG